MKLLAAGWLACLLLAQEPAPKKLPVTVRIDTLFGAGAPIKWHTLILEVTNQTAVDQEFRITASLGWSERAARRERFAPKVRKRLFLYLPATYYSNRIHISVEDEAGKEILNFDQETPLSSYRSGGSSYRFLVAALMERTPVQFPTTDLVRVIPEDLFPDRWLGLDGVAYVLLRDFRLDALLPAQRAALLEWVQRGGRVILYPGSNRDWLTSPAVQELAPVRLGESKEVDFDYELEAAYSRFREKTKYARHTILNGQPLGAKMGGAVQFRCGRGRVTVVPFDLERAPFDSWPGTSAFREALAADVRPDVPEDEPRVAYNMPRLSQNADFIHRAATVRVSQLPPFGLLLGLTLLYLVAVGPVNFMVLRRLRMTVRLVFTIPAISALFLGVVVLSGYLLRGTSTVTFEVCVLEAPSGGPLAFERHHLSIFSPMARTYDIAFGPGETGFVNDGIGEDRDSYEYRYGHRYGDPQPSTNIVYDQTDRWTLRDVAFQQWEARGFVGDAIRPIGGGVSFRVGTELEIVNRSPYAIRRGWVLSRDPGFQVYAFENVPAGETRRLPLRPVADAHRRHDWEDSASLEERIVTGWIYHISDNRFERPFLLCVLDRLPDEIAVDSSRSGQSDRVCLLQVGGEP